jgi:hypothetical protein
VLKDAAGGDVDGCFVLISYQESEPFVVHPIAHGVGASYHTLHASLQHVRSGERVEYVPLTTTERPTADGVEFVERLGYYYFVRDGYRPRGFDSRASEMKVTGTDPMVVVLEAEWPLSASESALIVRGRSILAQLAHIDVGREHIPALLGVLRNQLRRLLEADPANEDAAALLRDIEERLQHPE